MEYFVLRGSMNMCSGWVARIGIALAGCSVSGSALGQVPLTPPESSSDPEATEDTPEPPSPAPPADWRLELGARTAYSIPIGQVQGDADGDISDVISGQVPIWLDLGGRFSQHYFLGITGAYGFGVLPRSLSSACAADESASVAHPHCSAHGVRAGLELLYEPTMKDHFDPWLGAGVGWEWLSVAETANVQGLESEEGIHVNGPQLFMLQGGFDYMLTPGVGIGLFAAVSFDMYVSASISCRGACSDGSGGSVDIQDNTVHEWLSGGARVTFLP